MIFMDNSKEQNNWKLPEQKEKYNIKKKKTNKRSEKKLSSVIRSLFLLYLDTELIHQEFISRQNVQVNKLKSNSLKLFWNE